MQDANTVQYASLSPELQAKVDAVVDLMFSQNPHNTHPLLQLLRAHQRDLVAAMMSGGKP